MKLKERCAMCKHYHVGNCLKGNFRWMMDNWDNDISCEDFAMDRDLIKCETCQYYIEQTKRKYPYCAYIHDYLDNKKGCEHWRRK